MTIDPLPLAAAAGAGLLAGGLFFGGLWLTVRRLPAARHPGLLMAASTLARFAGALAIFFLAGRGHFDRVLACLAGFAIARWLIVRLTRPQPEEGDNPCA